MPTLGANTQCWHLPIQLDILVGANTECWHPVLTPMNTSRYTGRCRHWVLAPTNTSRHTGRCQQNIASAKLIIRFFEVLLIKKRPWLLNPTPTRILKSLCSLVRGNICRIVDMVYLYYSRSCSSPQMKPDKWRSQKRFSLSDSKTLASSLYLCGLHEHE